MAVLLEEVVLDLPDVLEPEAVGEFDLGECVLDEPLLVAVRPRSGQLVFVEDAESHVVPPDTFAWSHGPVSSRRDETLEL